jgi:F-type H+-transporting ATPase subunit b
MIIDWFTVVAQAMNFLILVWLLQRFLYKPVLRAIDAREQQTAKKLADAEFKEAAALQIRNQYQHKSDEFDRNSATMMRTVAEQAASERQRLLAEAQKAGDDARTIQQEALRAEAINLNQAIAIRTQQEVFAIARKTLQDLSTASLEERLVDVFSRRLNDLDATDKEKITIALRTLSGPALVRSAFELTPEQRGAVQRLLNESFSMDLKLHFESASDLICGIEFVANGQKLAWNIADYLSSLKKGISELLSEGRLNEKPKIAAAVVTGPTTVGLAAALLPQP